MTQGRFICMINVEKRDDFFEIFFIFFKICKNYIYFSLYYYIRMNNCIHCNFFTKEYKREFFSIKVLFDFTFAF